MEIPSYIYHGMKIFDDNTISAIVRGELLAFDHTGVQLLNANAIKRNGKSWLCGTLAGKQYCWYSCGCGGHRPSVPTLYLRRTPNGEIIG